MGEPFRHSLRVRYHECDPQGIVFNANYLAYHDIAVTELWREAFGSWDGFVAEHGVEMARSGTSSSATPEPTRSPIMSP